MRPLLKDIIIIASGFAVGLILSHRVFRNPPETQVITKVDTCVVTDTIVREKPVFVHSYIHDTIRTYFTTIEHDSVLVDVPIERKVYEEDSVYRAVLSGWHPSLDSLLIYNKTTEITITNTVTTPPKKWSFGVTVGPSLLVTPSGKVYGGGGVTGGITYRF